AILHRDPMRCDGGSRAGRCWLSSFNPCFTQTRKKGADMTRATRCAEYTPCLYLAFELGSDAWKLGFTTELGATPRVRTMPARDLERLTREGADPGSRRRQAMVRRAGRYPGAELLRGGPRRVLAAPVLDLQRDRQRGRGLVEYRSESTAPAREVGWAGCPQAARDAAAVPRGRARRVERGARAHGGGGGSTPAASRAPDLEAGTHAGGEPDERPAR